MRKEAILLVALTALIPLVSAQYISSPQELLTNQWFVFGLWAVLFFSVIFFAFRRVFPGDKNVAAVFAIVGGLLAATGVSHIIQML